MGFRTGAWAKVWSVEPFNDKITKARISVGKKNQQTGQYDTEFSGFVSFIGTSAATKAAKLNPGQSGESIQLGDVDVTTVYDPETKRTKYINYNIYSFKTNQEVESAQNNNGSNNAGNGWQDAYGNNVEIDNGEIEPPDNLPF